MKIILNLQTDSDNTTPKNVELQADGDIIFLTLDREVGQRARQISVKRDELFNALMALG